MSNAIVLNTVYAIDSNTGNFLSSGQILITNGLGGTNWLPFLSSLTQAGGNVLNNLPSSISTFTQNTGQISSLSASLEATFSTLSSAITVSLPASYPQQITSSLSGLANLGYVNSAQLASTVVGVQVTAPSLGGITSSIAGLSAASSGYVSQAQLTSTTTAQAATSLSAVTSLGYVDMPRLSTFTTQSNINILGSLGYVSTSYLSNVINNLGSLGYLSTFGTGGAGGTVTTYVTTTNLTSSISSVIQMKNSIRFDNVTTVNTLGNTINNFYGASTIIYISTFLTSSITYSGPQPGVEITGLTPNTTDLLFSTAIINMGSYSTFIDSNSRISIDVFPNIAFSKLGTGATKVAVVPISTLLMYGNTTPLYNTTVTSFLYLGNTRVTFENGSVGNASNFFNNPIKMYIPPNTINGNYQYPYSLLHYLPQGAVNNGSQQNALHNNTLTPFFASTGSLFISVQNPAK
jgi:hypothetical protein